MPRTRTEEGQALVESAIVVPMLLFVFLCVLQVMMIAHTRILLEYAAFSAARAGVVFNGNNSAMRNAAMIALIPSMSTSLPPGTAHTMTPVERFLRTWLEVKKWAVLTDYVDSGTALLENYLMEITGNKVNLAGMLPNVSVVSVDILNPGPRDFDPPNPNPEEIDFDLPARLETATPDDREMLRRTQLTIRVTYLYRLRVPLADRFLWYLYMMGAYVNAKLQAADVRDWWGLYGPEGQNVDAFLDKQKLATSINLADGDFPNAAIAWARDQFMFMGLKVAQQRASMFLMPLEALHTMPMESNLFRRHLNSQ